MITNQKPEMLDESVNITDAPIIIAPQHRPPGTRVWLHLRCAADKNQVLEEQEKVVKCLIEQKQWRLTRIFRDVGKPGIATTNPEAFESMIHLARQKPRSADLLIAWGPERFSRRLTYTLLYCAELRANGWQILFMADDLPMGLLRQFLEAYIVDENAMAYVEERFRAIRAKSRDKLFQKGQINPKTQSHYETTMEVKDDCQA